MAVELLELCEAVVLTTYVDDPTDVFCNAVVCEVTVVWERRFRVIVPGPATVTIVGFAAPEQTT